MRIAIVGFGAIGSTLFEALKLHIDIEVVGILTRSPMSEDFIDAPVTASFDTLLGLQPELIVECAGHQTVRDFGESILSARIDLLISSVGVLADFDLELRLRNSAASGGRLLIPSGAVAGVDALSAAKYAGIESVEYLGRKSPLAWRGTRAEQFVDLEKVSTPVEFFEGTARSAASAFPQNANVVASVALAGIGFDRTRVRLVVDPLATHNTHSISARGSFGEIFTQVTAMTFPSNPKTSVLSPFSLVRSIRAAIDSVIV